MQHSRFLSRINNFHDIKTFDFLIKSTNVRLIESG